MSGLNAGQIREAVKWHDGLSNQQSLGIIRSAALEHARRLDLVERGEAVWVEKQDGEWPRPLLNRVAGAINGPLVPDDTRRTVVEMAAKAVLDALAKGGS